MAISWSVGDIIACSQLAYKLIRALKDTGGAKEDYQDLINDLSSIHRTLLEVEHMHHATQLTTATINAILFEAHSLSKIMDDFLTTIEAYHSALSGLSAESSTSRYQDLALRKRLASHLQSITPLIAVAAFKAANDPDDALYDRYHARNKTPVEDIDNLVVYKQISKGAGGSEDNKPTELINPTYQRVKHPEKFFESDKSSR
ncbi:hypothetical protein LPUS_08929 [Lasallia pustulata]|uniref:Fungal N-terminal domain-containing protein n=1 Tax=Lasallia pustulata TaxID=136370 RepID=A0A1W5D690_9LECA|nr:hypothetical protein LPUS_08929 [Lasallia pustulata]